VRHAVLLFARRHWPALLALAYFAWRATRADARRDDPFLWVCLALGAAGVGLNLLVILANGGMPARVRDDEIPDDARPHYRPIGRATRLRHLADWIPVGHYLLSPGDVVLVVAVALLAARAALHFWRP
jgi:hypothetical protein